MGFGGDSGGGFGCGAEGKDRGGDGLVFVMMYGFEGRQKRVER